MRRNPRISVVVTEEDLAVLKRVSAATGETVSATVGGLVAVVSPVLARVATLSELAASAKADVKEGLLENMERVQSALEPQVVRALELMGLPVERFEDATVGGRGGTCHQVVVEDLVAKGLEARTEGVRSAHARRKPRAEKGAGVAA